jgi:hypothetical protein
MTFEIKGHLRKSELLVILQKLDLTFKLMLKIDQNIVIV